MLVMMGLNPAHEERLSVRALNTSDRGVILGAGLDVGRMPRFSTTRNGTWTPAASRNGSTPWPPT